ncbi:MAG: hypothetical protein MRZ79_06240 [Bacteroidia bacterium]|nr:hypothetical protein [Bacteroidia bacterium]
MTQQESRKQITKDLSPEQEAFLESKIIEGRYKASKWYKLLHKLERLDTLGDERLKSLNNYFFIPAILIFGGLLLIIFSEDFFRLAGIVTLVFGALFLTVLFVSIHGLRQNDLFNSFRLTAIPILELLKNDFAPNYKLNLFIDCSMPVSESNLREKRKEKNPGFMDTKLVFYEKEWMKGKGKLKDASFLIWSIRTHIEVKSYWKRGISGKTKQKRKAKARHKLRIQLELPKKLYTPKATIMDQIEVSDAGDSWKVKVKSKSKSKVKEYLRVNPALENDWMNPRLFTSALVKAYEQFDKDPKFNPQNA